MPDQRFRIEPLGKQHNRVDFSCGDAALDRYFRRHARQNAEQHIAAVFALVDNESGRVAGYCTLSSGSINLADLPADLAKKLPRYPNLPVILLGRLAIASERQGQGLGGVLLVDALQRALNQAANVGAMAVVVDAKGEQARSFYERFGFRRFADDDDRLFISVDTIKLLAHHPAHRGGADSA